MQHLGRIINWDPEDGHGEIESEEGETFSFSVYDCSCSFSPEEGLEVLFSVSEDMEVVEIHEA